MTALIDGQAAETQHGAAAWNFACPNWFERLQAGRLPIADLPLDQEKADKGLAIFNKLRVPDIDDKPTLAEACGDWFKDIVRVVFGSVSDDGNRHVPEIFGLVGKKNSKTTYSGGLILACLLSSKTPRAEILFVGPTQEIADAAFQQAVGMIEEDEEGYLQKRFQIQEHRKTIRDRVTKALIKIKTFDMKVMTGSKPIIVLIDELHIMGSIHFASRVIRQIRGALVRRKDSLLIIISTQSDEPPAGAFKAELDYARGVRDGRIRGNVRMLPILFEFPEEMQTDPDKPWADPRHWSLVMPNLGRSLHLDALMADYEAEREKGEEAERMWASQHLTIQIGLALKMDRWRGADHFEAAADKTITLDTLLERSEVVTAGIDGGGLDDLLGLAVLGRCKHSGDWLLWAKAWAQDDVLKLRKEIAEPLRDFAHAGDLVLCREPTQDVEELADLVERIFRAGLLPEKFGVGCDPVGVSAIVDALNDRGVKTAENGGPVCAVFQGYRLSSAVWGMERKLKDGTLKHGGRPFMNWVVSNAKAEQKGNAILITKQVSGKAKIDPLIAAFNAFFLMSRSPVSRRRGLDSFLKKPIMVA